MNDAPVMPEVPAAVEPTETQASEVLGKLFTTGVIKLPVFNKEVTIKKVTLRTMKPILDLLAVVIGELKLTADNLPGVNLQDPGLILKLISTHYDEVVKIVVSLTTLSEDELLDMEQDESVIVIQAVIARNKAFFTTKVLPSLQMLGKVAEG